MNYDMEPFLSTSLLGKWIMSYVERTKEKTQYGMKEEVDKAKRNGKTGYYWDILLMFILDLKAILH